MLQYWNLNVLEQESGGFLVVRVKVIPHELLPAGHIESSLGGTNLSNSPALFSCIVNADEAVMINLQSQPWNHRSLLNHAGFMAQANPLCRDHRERHQRSGTNTLVWGAFALSRIVPRGWKRLKGEDSASLWLRNTPVAPCWPGVGTGRSHRGSQVHASLITPAETMSGNDA